MKQQKGKLPWESFGKLLKDLRSRPGAKMTQVELSSRLGKSASEVSRWEKGERRPKNNTLLDLANIFGVKVQDLQTKAGYTPEFDWQFAFSAPQGHETDILLGATEEEKVELRRHLLYLRFKAQIIDYSNKLASEAI